MATVLKCKMCGGDIEVSQDMTVGTCLYCGSTMTLPRIESEKKARLFNRANQYRLNNEFDKAYDAYRAIVDEDEQEAEAYWGLILSEYGVEYVEDPKTGKRIPTCHRTRVQSITSSVNYKQALQYADAESKFIYQDEAEVLDKLQKKIIAVSAKEEPYDVFICYKETDENTGERSKDSVMAQQVYDALQEKGIRTFFSRISLEDKVGQNYEPFIYAALNSARVMILISSSNEHCNATWVKNEWMRFIQFMEEDKNKSIIPACYEMSPYELPDELTSYQAQDLGKVGAVQDLVYGVTKLLGKAPRESNNQILNELLDEKNKRQKRKSVLIRLLVFFLVGIVAFNACTLFWSLVGFNDGYMNLDIAEMLQMNLEALPVFLLLLVIGLLFDLVGMIWGLIRGYTKPWPKRLLTIGFMFLTAAICQIHFKGFIPTGLYPAFYLNLIWILIITFMNIRYDKRSEAVIRIIIIALCLVLGRSHIGLDVPVIANATEMTEVNQIVINNKFVNIRKDATTESDIVGRVYNGMVFDIVDSKKQGNYTWYKIHTENGVEGYVRGDFVSYSVKILITDEYINVRENMGTSYKKIGEVYRGQTYISYYSKKQGSRTWYKIKLEDGTFGYIGAEGIKELN